MCGFDATNVATTDLCLVCVWHHVSHAKPSSAQRALSCSGKVKMRVRVECGRWPVAGVAGRRWWTCSKCGEVGEGFRFQNTSCESCRQARRKTTPGRLAEVQTATTTTVTVSSCGPPRRSPGSIQSLHPPSQPPTADRRRCCRPVYSFSYSIHPPPPCLAPCCPGDYPASSARLPMSVPRRSHLAGYYGAQHKGPTPPSLETVGHSRASCTRAPISGSKENGQSKLALRRFARRRGALGEHQPGSRPSCS